MKLLAARQTGRGCSREGRSSSPTSCAGNFEAVGATEPSSEGIIDVLRSVESLLVSALIREPPRDEGGKVSLRSSVDEVNVRAIARKSGGGGHREAARFSSDLSVDEITDFIVREVSGRVGAPAGAWGSAAGARAQRGSSSWTSLRGRRRSSMVAAVRRRTGARTGRAGTLDPFATGLLLLLSGASTHLQVAWASTSAT